MGSNSMLGFVDGWLVNRTDRAIAVVQERAGVSLPMVQIGFVLVSAATYWFFMIHIAVHLGDVLPRWAAIASASAMLALATLVTAFSFARRVRVQLRDARGEWTDAKHKLYVKAAVHFRAYRFRARIWGFVLTALISIGYSLASAAGSSHGSAPQPLSRSCRSALSAEAQEGRSRLTRARRRPRLSLSHS